MALRSYQELVVWQRSIEFAEDVYRVTQSFPRQEIYGITNQLRRASVSIASNIAERQGRGKGAEFAHFLRITQGSIQEAETQIVLAHRLGYVPQEDFERLLAKTDELSRLNRGLQRSLRA